MDLVYARCAGLDVHKATVVGCMRVPGPRREDRQTKTRTFATTLRGLEELTAWLTSHGVTHVAMESTGVYWRPVYAGLEGTVQVLLVNARHVQMVPGRKTDVRDSEWLAQLLECGLLRGSFVPAPAVRDLRDLTRLRKALIRERGHHVNRIEKTLELANVKLGTVVTDIMGKTGRAILEALSAGRAAPEQLAALAQGSIRTKKQAALREAVAGRLTPHYAFLLHQHLSLIEALDAHIVTLDARIEAAMAPFAEAAALVQTMPGVATRAAQAILAETGVDMGPFPPRRTSRRGRGCVPAPTRARASVGRPPRARAPSGSARRCKKPPGRRRAPSGATTGRSTTGSKGGAGPRKLSSPCSTRCS